MNLLTESITPEAKESELFKHYMNNIGYDSNGKFLEETLYYDDTTTGFPLCSYIKNNYCNLFLTRTVRNAAMQNLPKNKDEIISTENIFYRKILYRTIFQAFIEKYFEEIKNIYGYGKIELEAED